MPTFAGYCVAAIAVGYKTELHSAVNDAKNAARVGAFLRISEANLIMIEGGDVAPSITTTREGLAVLRATLPAGDAPA